MTLSELESYYLEHKPTAYELNTKKHRWFKKELKEALSYIVEMDGEKKFELYVFALLNGYHSGPPPCEYCGSPVRKVRKARFNTYCSPECKVAGTIPKMIKTTTDRYGGMGNGSPVIRKRVEETNVEKWGVSNFFETDSFKSTNWALLHYGVDHISQSEEIKQLKKQNRIMGMSKDEFLAYERSKMSVQERWGADHPMKTDEGKKLQKEGLITAHGVENPMELESSRINRKKTNMERYGVEHYFQSQQHKDFVIQNNARVDRFTREHFNRTEEQEHLIRDKDKLEALYEEYGTIYALADVTGISATSLGRVLKFHGIDINQHHRRSVIEDQIHSFITTHIDKSGVFLNDRTHGFEIDIFVPEKRVAIEVNGLYWHSEIHKERLYHQKKSQAMIDLGLKHIHVWEDHWRDPVKREIVKSRILYMLGIPQKKVFARKTTIRIGDVSSVMKFYEATHIQGKKKANYHVSLIHEEEVVAAMSLTDKGNGVWYLERYATTGVVVGGFSKCLNAFIKNNEVKEIHTHAHKDYSNGNLYRKSGFEYLGDTVPNYFYSKGLKRISRHQAMKHRLRGILKGFDPTISEHKNMNNHGFFRVYDSGSMKFRLLIQ